MGTFSRMLRASARANRRAYVSQVRAQKQALREAERNRKAAERARIADQKEKVRLYLESRIEETKNQNDDLQQEVRRLSNLLLDSLSHPFSFTLDSLIEEADIPKFEPGKLANPEKEPEKDTYIPHKSLFNNLIPGMEKHYQQKVADAEETFAKDLEAYKKRENERQKKLEEAQAAYAKQIEKIKQDTAAQNAEIEKLKSDLPKGTPEAVTTYYTLAFDNAEHHEDFPSQIKFAYIPESKQLVVEYDLPAFDVIPEVASYKYVKTTDTIISSPATTTFRKNLYALVVAQETLRLLHLLFDLDQYKQIESIVLNGYVETIDKGTGKTIRPCIVTIRTTQNAFADIDLSKVDPSSCLKVLNASMSRSPSDLAPVKPVLEFNMVDPRFVQETDVLSGLDQRPNLMDLTPGKFESLITNLFEKMGLETRLTQASRDGGVDCVAYDSRPVLGGKVVIQAKRYKHTVGVSAVRDLFGTTQNEGASKGILVTTSGYGKAAFDFAEGKPLELLSGTNLLYLLEKYTGIQATIKASDDWQDPEPDGNKHSME